MLGHRKWGSRNWALRTGPRLLLDADVGYIAPGLAYTRTIPLLVPQRDGSLLSVAADTPPREWNGSVWGYGSDPGWTQSLLRTHDFGHAAWTKTNVLAPAQDAIGPNGAVDSWALVEDTTATTNHDLMQSQAFTSGTWYTLRAVASARTGNRYLSLFLPSAAFGTNAIATFDLGTGAWVKNATAAAASAVQLANGSWLCTMTAQATATTSASMRIRLHNSLSATVPSYTGDGASGINVWCANVTNTAYPVPLTSATSAAVTVGSPSWSGLLSAMDLSLGGGYTIGCEYVAAPMAGTPPYRSAMQVDAGSDAHRSLLRYSNAAGGAGALIDTGGVNQFTGTFTAAEGALVREALRVSAADARAALNGALNAAPAAVTLPSAPTHARIGANSSGAEVLPGHILRAWIAPRAFTDAELIAYTTDAWPVREYALESAAIDEARRNNISMHYMPIGRLGMYQDDAGTTAAAVGSVIGLMRDSQYGRGGQVGSGMSLSQATAARRPALMQDCSGRYGATFDGVDDRLAAAAQATPSTEYLCVAGSCSDATSTMALMGRRLNAAGAMIRRESTGQALAAIAMDGAAAQSVVLGQPAVGERFLASMLAASGGSKGWIGGLPAGVLLTTYAPADGSTTLAVGSEKGSAATSPHKGKWFFSAYATSEPPAAARQVIERFGAAVANIQYKADLAPTLYDLTPNKVSATKYVSIPYLDRGWAEITAGGAQWNAVLDVYLPAGSPPVGGWPVVCWFHPNGQSRTITDGGDAALNMRDPLLAAGYAVVSIEFAHPIVCKAALGSDYTDSYHDIGRAVQKVRSLAGAFTLNPARIGAVAQSRGSLAIYTALMADRRTSAGTHQEQQSSLISAMWIINGQSMHRALTTANAFIVSGDRAGFLTDYPDDPATLDATDMVAGASQVPYLHLVHDRAYYGSLQPRANVEGDVHYPDFHLALKQRYQAAGYSAKVTDAPSTPAGDKFVGLVSWMEARA